MTERAATDPAPTSLAVAVMDRLVATYAAARDPHRAAGAAAYMRGQFPFLGIATPQRRALSRTVLAGLPVPTQQDLAAVALGCWGLPEREYQYFACDLLARRAGGCGPDFLAVVRTLITAKSWWDTVDALATHVVGALVSRHGDLRAEMDAWSAADNLWLIRTALLHQLTYRSATDATRLFAYCTRQAGHPDFFVRKAIGWALRQHARTDPDAVRRYLAAHAGVLSPLSIREAAKHL